MKTKKSTKNAHRTPLADSVAAAASMLDRPLAEVLRAKRAGCRAFKNSRVNLVELSNWFAEERLRFDFQNMAFVCVNVLRELEAERPAAALVMAKELGADGIQVEDAMRAADRELIEGMTLAKFLKIRGAE